MARCQINGCTNEVTINPKTGRPNLLCHKHFRESIGSISQPGRGASSPRRGSKQGKKPQTNKGPAKPELFVLRGHTLTINYTGKTRHINVDRLTRAVMYNDEREGASGKMFRYVIDIKQGIEVVGNILFDSKKERDREFAKLQALLSGLY